jgi:hypothetical protein
MSVRKDLRGQCLPMAQAACAARWGACCARWGGKHAR